MTVQAAELPVLEAFRKPTSAISESALVYGYRRAGGPSDEARVRVEPCACGGLITAIAGDERSIYLAVAGHNESTAHQQWRARRERA